MAHALTERSNGMIEFAYRAAEGKGWHGLGQAVEDGATAADWKVKAGMDWAAVGAPVTYTFGEQTMVVPGQQVLHRADTGLALGIVSDSYKIVQPEEAIDFFGEMMRVGSLKMSAAGTIHGGRVFWATAKMDEAAPVSVKDKIGAYLLLSSSLDGSRATEARFTSTRVVCQNTLRIALGEGKASVKVSHRSEFDAEAFKRELGLADNGWSTFKHNLVRLANKPMEMSKAEDIVARLLASGNSQSALETAVKSRGFAKVLGLFAGDAVGSDLDGVQGTAYGLLNAVTEYSTHHARARGADHRFDSAMWGAGDKLNAAAMSMLLAA